MTPTPPAPLWELSRAELLVLAPPEERQAFVDALGVDAAEALRTDWDFWARPDQMPPPDPWRLWLVIQGRGAGKTRTGAEWVRKRAREDVGSVGLFVGADAADVRDLMVEGRSGITTISPPGEAPLYEPSKRTLTWPNDTMAYLRSAADPDGIRGPSVDWAWADEPAKWRYLKKSWDNLRLALREGRNAQSVVTTTPRPLKLIKDLLAGTIPGTVHAPRVSTYRNRANLDPGFLAELLATYEGTRLGAQELYAEILEEVEGALWTLALLGEDMRVGPEVTRTDMARIVVAVDPSWGTKGDECGIIVAGLGKDRLGYVLEDLSIRAEPAKWGAIAVDAYKAWEADVLCAEVNFGAEMVKMVLKTVAPEVPFKEVHASRGKQQRAEPVVALYQQGRIRHRGHLGLLEQQYLEWVPPGTSEESSTWSPDRLDAAVWALSELMLRDHGPVRIGGPSNRIPVRGRGGVR